jgi:hypothetical protein
LFFAFGFATVLAGCHPDVADVAAVLHPFFRDHPTTFEQAGPISLATSEDSVIFKSPTKSNNCMLFGGTVTLTATIKRRPLRAPVIFSYTHVRGAVRNDILRIDMAAGGFAIDGRGRYRFDPAAAGSAWQSLEALPPGGVEHRMGFGDISSIYAVRNGQFRVAIVTAGSAERSIFRGTILPSNGVVYLRDAVMSDGASSFAGRSGHNCGEWDTAEDATAALGRVEAHWPTPPAPVKAPR